MTSSEAAKLSPSQSVLQSVVASAERLRTGPEVIDLLSSSWREVRAQIPVRMDNRKLKIFEGYRVQHNGARGPYKGGVRFHPSPTSTRCARWPCS